MPRTEDLQSKMRLCRRIIPAVLVTSLLLWSAVQAGDETDRAARRQQIKQCRALLKQSVREIESERYDSALTLLGTARECDSTNPDVYYYTGRVLLARGDTTGAQSSLTSGVEKAPLSSRLKLLLARLKTSRGAPEESLALVESVLAVKPRHGEALYIKGLILLEMGDSTRAADLWQKALEVTVERDVW